MIFSEGTTDDLDDTTLTAEKEYLINFPEKKINSCIFVNDVEIYKFKGKDSEGNAALLWLGNLSKGFSHVMIKKTWIILICLRFFNWLWQYWCWWHFRYSKTFNEKTWSTIMFILIKQIFIAVLSLEDP